MIRPSALSAATLLWAVLATVSAQAMQIQQFDKMAGSDQDAYIVGLVQGAEKVLNDARKTSDAQAVHKLFTSNADNGISIGMNEFMITLALVRVSDAERVSKDPKGVRLEVEHAIYIALKKDGIVLPQSIMTVMNNFKPKAALKL